MDQAAARAADRPRPSSRRSRQRHGRQLRPRRCRMTAWAKIKELGEMRSQGLLSNEEFDVEKVRILAT